MSEHFIERCKYCAVVVSQCRCIGPNKTERYVVCPKCADLLSDDPLVTARRGGREAALREVRDHFVEIFDRNRRVPAIRRTDRLDRMMDAWSLASVELDHFIATGRWPGEPIPERTEKAGSGEP